MVSSALVRRFFRLLPLAAFAVIAVLAAWTLVRGRDPRRRSGCAPSDRVDKGRCEIATRRVSPTDDELRAYLRIMQEVVNAYSNCQIEAMIESMRQLPSKAYQLIEKDHLKLEIPINQIWRGDWVLNRGIREFASEEEFDRQMKRSLAIAKLYGEFLVASGRIADEILVTIDWIALKRLQKYREGFKRDGKTDCLQSAERLLADWIEQIESKKGFTRTYMRAQKVGLRHFVKTGELSEERSVQYVRDYVRPLRDRCGYTPKWLDAEFPSVSTSQK